MARQKLEGIATPLTEAIDRYRAAHKDTPYAEAMQAVLREDASLAGRHIVFTDYAAGFIDLQPEHLTVADRALLHDQLVNIGRADAELFAAPRTAPARKPAPSDNLSAITRSVAAIADPKERARMGRSLAELVIGMFKTGGK